MPESLSLYRYVSNKDKYKEKKDTFKQSAKAEIEENYKKLSTHRKL